MMYDDDDDDDADDDDDDLDFVWLEEAIRGHMNVTQEKNTLQKGTTQSCALPTGQCGL